MAPQGSVYFHQRQSTAGAIMPLGEPDWLNWSCDKHNTLGLAYGPCHKT